MERESRADDPLGVVAGIPRHSVARAEWRTPRNALSVLSLHSFVVPARLCPVAALPHVTPTAAVVSAYVQEEPVAVPAAAPSHAGDFSGMQHVSRGLNHRPQHAVKGFLVRSPLPREPWAWPGHPKVGEGSGQRVVQRGKVGVLRRPFVDNGREDTKNRFAELNGMPKSSGRVLGAAAALLDQLLGLPVGQDSSQSPPGDKVLVAPEFFVRVGSRISQCVGEVQAQPAAGKLKHRSLFKSVRHPIPRSDTANYITFKIDLTS